MSDPSDWRQSSAAEFPNDNPALHGGAIWVCFAPCGPLRPVVRPRSGGRPSTIPAPLAGSTSNSPPPLSALTDSAPNPQPAPLVEAPDATSEEASITEVTCLTTLADDDGMPSSVDLAPAPALEVRPALLDLTEDDAAAPEGCSLSAGLKPTSTAAETEELRDSEMRARPLASTSAEGEAPIGNADSTEPEQAADSDAAEAEAAALGPVDVECAPSVPHVDPPETVAACEENPEVRRTILPPPSEEMRTLTLTRIHVPGRSQVPVSAATQSVESSNEVSSAAGAKPEHEGARPDPFAAFVVALVEVALAAGATRAAAVLPGFLDGVHQDFAGSPDSIRMSLLDSGLAREADGALVPSEAFGVTAGAWRMVLRGESNDFSACGTSTLDGWAADLLKSFGVGRDGRVDVKRELRRRGVAAFGMILAA